MQTFKSNLCLKYWELNIFVNVCVCRYIYPKHVCTHTYIFQTRSLWTGKYMSYCWMQAMSPILEKLTFSFLCCSIPCIAFCCILRFCDTDMGNGFVYFWCIQSKAFKDYFIQDICLDWNAFIFSI